jgi:hypothetical protein
MVKIIILMTMFDLIDLIPIVKLHPQFPNSAQWLLSHPNSIFIVV